MIGRYPTEGEVTKYDLPEDVPAFLPAVPHEVPLLYNSRIIESVSANRLTIRDLKLSIDI